METGQNIDKSFCWSIRLSCQFRYELKLIKAKACNLILPNPRQSPKIDVYVKKFTKL